MPPPIKIKSRYEVKTVLGRGGMGVVYQAFDTLMKRDVAVKTLREVPDGVMVELFYRECTVLAGMVHPNVIEIFDMGEFEDGDNVSKPFYVMPLLPGRTLYDLLYPESTPLPAARCVDIISQACRGLQAAHDRDLLHRDIKPRNIFVMRDDAVKLIDFGVAHLMGSNSTGVRGTPQYMSPEQISFKPLQRQSDIFSMATVCYEALTAAHPFLRSTDGRDSVPDIASAITSYTPPLVSDLNPAVNRAVAQVVAKGMAKDPWNRFESAAEFADALQKALRNEGTAKPSAAGVQIRIERARRSLQQQDLQFASEIIGELESEGHSDPEIRRIRADLEAAIRKEKTDRLIEAAARYFASDEFTLALRKVQEVLHIEPANQTALDLKKKIEDVITEQRVDDLLRTAADCIERAAFTSARQALQDALKLRPNDMRARQLLSEVDSRQKEILKHRQDQERLFQAAHEAWLAGNIKLALANLDELTKLSPLLPEPPERTNEYQEFHRRIRSEHEAVEGAFKQARELLAKRDLPAAQRICDRYLRKYSNHEDFAALADELAKRREEEAKAYRANIAARLASEPNLNAQAEILEEALSVRPKDEYFEQEMARVQEKQKEVKAVAAKARSFEKQQAFEAALHEWENLFALYPHYPNVEEQIAKARAAWQNQRAQIRADWVKQINKALGDAEHVTALRLLNDAQREFAADAELNELAAKAQEQAKRFEAMTSLLEEGLAAANAKQFQVAQQALCEAADLSRGVPRLVKTTTAALVRASGMVVDPEWRVAKALIEKASQLDTGVQVPASLRREIESREREEGIRSALEAAQSEQQAGRLPAARALVEKALTNFVREPRLISLLNSIDAVIAENRRRQEREEALRSLKALMEALPARENPTELQASVQRAKTTADRYPGDAEFAQIANEISDHATAYEKAAEALTRDETKSCIALCDEMLARVPEYQLFQNLKLQATLRDTQKAAEFLDSVERQLAAEPDLGKRVSILEDAVLKSPEESYFQEELRLVRGKQELVNAITHRAQEFEKNGWFAEALERWQYLKTIHPVLPGLDDSIARCSGLLEEKRERSRQQHLASIRAALDAREYGSALQDFSRALVEFPDDPDLWQLGKLAREGKERRLRCEKLLNEGLERLEAGQFQDGRETLRKAVEIDPEDPTAPKSAAAYLLEYAREALPLDLATAESMIAEARAFDPEAQPPPDLQRAVADRRRRAEFEKCSQVTRSLEDAGDIDGAINVAREFLSKYPGDADAERLRDRLLAIQEEARQQAQRARDLDELRDIENQAATVFKATNLLDLVKKTEQIAQRHAEDEGVTIAAGELRGLVSALAEIRRLMDEGRLQDAQRLCTTSAERFPHHAGFPNLQAEIEARQREQAEHYLDKTKQALAAQADFRKHAPILDAAILAYPDEPYYADELRLVRNKEALLEREVARARELESNGLYEDALHAWETLRSLYPWFPSVDIEIARVARLFEEQKAAIEKDWTGRIRDAIKAGNYDLASQLIFEARSELPENPRLAALAEELQEIRRKHTAAQEAFEKSRILLAKDDLEGALVSFNIAMKLTPADAELRKRFAALVLARAQSVVDEHWAQAERLVAVIGDLAPGYVVPAELQEQIRRHRRADELARLLAQIDREIEQSNWMGAQNLLERARRSFPDEPAVRQRAQGVSAALSAIEAERIRTAALGALAELRSRLNSPQKRRPLLRLRAAIEAAPYLTAEDPDVRATAETLLAELDAKLAALDAPPPAPARAREPVPKTPEASASRRADSVAPRLVRPALLIAAALAIALGIWGLVHALSGPKKRTAELPVTPARVIAPAVQIAGNVPGAEIFVDGTKVGAADAGAFTLNKVAKGAHVLSISGDDGKASVPVLSTGDGNLAIRGPVSSTNLSLLAVAQRDGAESLISSSVSPQPVYLDGQRVGVTSGGTLPLPKLGDDAHQIQVGDGGALLRFSLPANPRPSLYTFIAGKGNQGTLRVSINVPDADLIVDGKRYPSAGSKGKFQLVLPAKTYQLTAERAGYVSANPVRATVDRSSETAVDLRLAPRPAILELRGAAAGTTLRVDGTIVGVVAAGRPLRRQVGAGNHSFELTRDGFLPKRFERRLNPGETTLIGGNDVDLPPVTDTEAVAWAKAHAAGTAAELRDFVDKYPSGPHAVQAQQLLNGLDEAAKAAAEQNDWNALNKDSRKSIEDFLTKYPGGAHAPAASLLLADLKKKEAAAVADQAEANAWSAVNVKDRQSLENYIRSFPTGRHRGDAERALSSLTASTPAPPAPRLPTPNSTSPVPATPSPTSPATPAATPGSSGGDSTAVLHTVQQLANAWNEKNTQALLEAQPTLDRRQLKKNLAAVRTMHVTISPLGAPKVTGDRATLTCHRKVEQVFSDGTTKSAESTVTLTLVKSAGRWVVESIQ